jgi:hypothetical protein
VPVVSAYGQDWGTSVKTNRFWVGCNHIEFLSFGFKCPKSIDAIAFEGVFSIQEAFCFKQPDSAYLSSGW